MSEQIQIVKKTIEEILQKMTLEAKIDVLENADGAQFVIRTPNGGLIIGENGKNLISFNHIVKKIIEKKLGDNKQEGFAFSLDVNDYQVKRVDELKDLARLNAQRVRYFKKEVVLKPMNSFERRIVHSVLSDCPDIVTESRGQEPGRQIVIKPYL